MTLPDGPAPEMRDTRGEHVDWKAGEVTVDGKEKRRGHTSICPPGSRKNAHALVGVEQAGRLAAATTKGSGDGGKRKTQKSGFCSKTASCY